MMGEVGIQEEKTRRTRTFWQLFESVSFERLVVENELLLPVSSSGRPVRALWPA
jgi:hypothetical protein